MDSPQEAWWFWINFQIVLLGAPSSAWHEAVVDAPSAKAQREIAPAQSRAETLGSLLKKTRVCLFLGRNLIF